MRDACIANLQERTQRLVIRDTCHDKPFFTLYFNGAPCALQLGGALGHADYNY